jgi:hypothetical protein
MMDVFLSKSNLQFINNLQTDKGLRWAPGELPTNFRKKLKETSQYFDPYRSCKHFNSNNLQKYLEAFEIGDRRAVQYDDFGKLFQFFEQG